MSHSNYKPTIPLYNCNQNIQKTLGPLACGISRAGGSKKRRTLKGGNRCLVPPNPTPSSYWPQPPNPVPSPNCQFPHFRPLVLSQFGGKYKKTNTKKAKKKIIKKKTIKKKTIKKKIKKNKTKKSGGNKRIYAPQPMEPTDQREINLCLSTPLRFSKQWVHQNLVSNSHMPIDTFDLDFYIETWNNHIRNCLEWQEWASQHENDGSLYDYAAPNLLAADFNEYDPVEDKEEEADDDDEFEDVDMEDSDIWE